MASISTDPNGNRTVQFVGADRKRRSVRLGRVPMKAAEEVCRRVEALNACRITGTALDADSARWVRDLDVGLARKLARAGLVGPRPDAGTLGTFTRDYIAGRADLRAGSLVNLNRSRLRLLEFFDANTPLRDITPADVDRWRIWLAGRFADATVARTLKHARQFFTAARRGRLLAENPFEGVKAGSMRNPTRLFFVTAEMSNKLVEAAPDADWRGIIALCRWGGLRCPSEVLALTWADIDWDRGRFLVRASKTEHHENRGLRWVPLFPELRPHLEAVWDRAEPGAVPVITRYRDPKQNMRTTFEKIIVRAGLTPWPRLMQNLRASRETELAARFPLHVVTAWMGNTEAVAARHYLSVRDEDFAEALRNPVQQVAARGCIEGKVMGGEGREGRETQGGAVPCIPAQRNLMTLTGFEPVSPP